MADILTISLVRRGLELVRPGIEHLLKSRDAGIIIAVTAVEEINPRIPGNTFASSCYVIMPMGAALKDHEQATADALSKAELTLRGNKPNGKLPPQYLRSGDTVKIGGVLLEGLIIGVAGDKGPYDELYGYMAGAGIQALCKDVHLKIVASGAHLV